MLNCTKRGEGGIENKPVWCGDQLPYHTKPPPPSPDFRVAHSHAGDPLPIYSQMVCLLSTSLPIYSHTKCLLSTSLPIYSRTACLLSTSLPIYSKCLLSTYY